MTKEYCLTRYFEKNDIIIIIIIKVIFKRIRHHTCDENRTRNWKRKEIVIYQGSKGKTARNGTDSQANIRNFMVLNVAKALCHHLQHNKDKQKPGHHLICICLIYV